MNKYIKKIFNFCAMIYLLTLGALAQPLVILEYDNNGNTTIDAAGLNFLNSENYSKEHRIAQNETLSKIIEKYYGNGNLNLKFVQSAIVHKNRNVFVRSNPNFMFAGKKLYLPSINEIKNLVYRTNKNIEKDVHTSQNHDIYFFGN
tara:strand:- start:2407 stop:2844 length:438 start_codon:yes stop_codon:yes gene_type:complete